MFYKLSSKSSPPVSNADMTSYLKASASESALIDLMLEAATTCGERLTQRTFRIKQYEVYADSFDNDGFEITLSPLDSIDSITYTDELGAPQTVDPSVYYLKKGKWWSEILLMPDKEWPTDVMDVGNAIVITVSTVAHEDIEAIKLGIMRHVAYVFQNRGDCGDSCTTKNAKSSGAYDCYKHIRIPRI